MLLIGLPVMFLLFVIAFAVAYVIKALANLVCGYKPTLDPRRDFLEHPLGYDGKFWLPTLRGHRILPLTLALVALFGWGGFGALKWMYARAISVVRGSEVEIVLAIVSVVFLGLLVWRIISRFWKSEAKKLVVDFFKAKKEKVCPLIEFSE